MSEQESSDVLTGLTLDDIGFDEFGRVTIANPEIADRITDQLARKPKERPRPNDNCPSNTSMGCGSTNNVAGCGATNTVSNCGCVGK
jgi:hypothetical protein